MIVSVQIQKCQVIIIQKQQIMMYLSFDHPLGYNTESVDDGNRKELKMLLCSRRKKIIVQQKEYFNDTVDSIESVEQRIDYLPESNRKKKMLLCMRRKVLLCSRRNMFMIRLTPLNMSSKVLVDLRYEIKKKRRCCCTAGEKTYCATEGIC